MRLLCIIVLFFFSGSLCAADDQFFFHTTFDINHSEKLFPELATLVGLDPNLLSVGHGRINYRLTKKTFLCAHYHDNAFLFGVAYELQ